MEGQLTTETQVISTTDQGKSFITPELISKLRKIKQDLILKSSIFSRSLRTKFNSFSNRVGSVDGGSNKNNKKLFILVGGIGVVVVVLGALLLMGGGGDNTSTLGIRDERPEATESKSKQDLNKTFQFPIRDSAGKEVSKFKYEITSVELYDSIIVKGQRARAVKGRTFLIMNLKIVNDNSLSAEINTRDYVRVSVNNKEELIAPDIHNDPVAVQAISTKYTRIGLAINDNDKDIMLHVGEIKGKKENIKINF